MGDTSQLMFPKKRKFTPSAPTSPPKLPGSLHAKTQPTRPQLSKEFTKSWKGRVLVRNKTVKKPDRATKTVVWFASEPAGTRMILISQFIF